MSSNLPAMPAYMANMMPSLPQEMRAQLAQMFAPALESFGSAFNRISLKGSRFRLITGGNETATFSDAFTFVIVAISPEQYCAWYANKYTGEEGVEPDAVWAQNEEPPANVPMSARVKDAEGRNQYSMRRRFIVAPVLTNQQGKNYVDLENLYVWDAGGMTTFGDDITLAGGSYHKAHSFSSYMNVCKSSGMFPCAIMTTAIFDSRQSVPAARFLPVCNAQGVPVVLDMNTLNQVVQKAVSPATQQLLDWRRGRSNDTQPQPQPQPQPVAQQTSQQVVQQPAPQVTVAQPAPHVLQENPATVYQDTQSAPQADSQMQTLLQEFESAPALDSDDTVQQTVSAQNQAAGHVETVASSSELEGVVINMTKAVGAATQGARQAAPDAVKQAAPAQPAQPVPSEQPGLTADDLVARINNIMDTF